MSSSSSATFPPIPIFFLWALSYWTLKDTDNWTESALRFNNSSVSFYKYEFVPDHAIPSLFGYIIVVTILTVLPGPYSRSTNFRRWTNLTSIFLVIPFHLKQQAWVRVCVVPMVPMTFGFIIPLTWCRRWLITSSWNLSTNVSWSSSTLWVLPGYQLNSWWEIPSLSLDDLSYHRQHSCLPPPTQTCSQFVLYLGFLAIQQLFFFTSEVLPSLFVKNVVRISPPLNNSWYHNTSCHLRSFLGPRIVFNRNTDNWAMSCEFKTSSKPLALKWNS